MKNIRIFYEKKGRMKFVSHLDMTRFMSRMLKKAAVPIWYTEGFHPHPYLTFALPLSLGFESRYEVMDIRLTDDEYSSDELCLALNGVLPEYIRVLSAEEPIMKAGKIAFADFEITFSDGGTLYEDLCEFLNSDSILTEKKTKKGAVKEIDLAPKIENSKAEKTDNTKLFLTLPAGSEDNLNPELLLNAFFTSTGHTKCHCAVTRTMIYNTDMEQFK